MTVPLGFTSHDYRIGRKLEAHGQAIAQMTAEGVVAQGSFEWRYYLRGIVDYVEDQLYMHPADAGERRPTCDTNLSTTSTAQFR